MGVPVATDAHTTGTLHVYASDHPHTAVHIAGNRDALLELQGAIGRALAANRPEFAGAFTADGEGYVVVVMPEADMADTALPYAETVTTGRCPRPTWAV